jgi:hypothetical protein
MAALFDNKDAKKPGTGSLTEPKAGDAKPLGGPASQGDNPENQHTAEGVTPDTGNQVDEVPNPGPDHEAVLRSAKHAGAAGALGKDDDELEEIGQRVAQARRLVAKRNRSTDPGEVKSIDSELEGLGFASPVATTEYQREVDAPVGRRAPGASKA